MIKDINKPKVKQLYDRLKRINPSANIKVVTEFITEENLKDILYDMVTLLPSTL
ncbi:ThiF family adenylyltransferase [Riemerella columbina]|uniref:ThiF family adenylyltransferase n=1 Tax=Riemerella columbina TaxID=103810 RepID=UPI0003A1D25D|nr:ThiF family adenylyltransferase [Riemerella columbina]